MVNEYYILNRKKFRKKNWNLFNFRSDPFFCVTIQIEDIFLAGFRIRIRGFTSGNSGSGSGFETLLKRDLLSEL